MQTFTNSGTITGATDYGVHISGTVQTFDNSGTISGDQTGVYVYGAVNSFTNSGTITGTTDYGVRISGTVQTFNNSKTITGGDTGVYLYKKANSFTNSGTITGTSAYGVYIGGDVQTFNNSGTITSDDGYGAYFNGAVNSFTNSGTISGTEGVYFGAGGVNLTNSGLIAGTSGTAVSFTGADNTLDLETGGKFQGTVDFGSSNGTFDFANYHGNLVLGYAGSLDNLDPGSNLYVNDTTNSEVVIVSDAGIKHSSQPTSDIVGGISDLLDAEFDAVGAGSTGSIGTLNYASPAPRTAAQTAADSLVAAPPVPSRKFWATAIGGGSSLSGGDGTHNAYGALVTGGHAEVGPGLTVGVFAGYARSRQTIDNGPQTIDADTGLFGVYGKKDMGLAMLDFSLLGGVSTNSSSRDISTPTGTDTATASFNGWFLAPQIGGYVPVFETGNSKVGVEAKLGYITGGLSGYSETGSAYGLTVGSQTIGLLNSSVGITDTMVLQTSAFGDTTVKGDIGVFTQTNVGSSNVAVSVLNTPTTGSSAPSGTTYGLKAGASFKMSVSRTFDLGAGVDGSVRSDGALGGAARVKISGAF